MSDLHEVSIVDNGDGQFTLTIDGREVQGVTSYSVHRRYQEKPRVEISFIAATVTAVVKTPFGE